MTALHLKVLLTLRKIRLAENGDTSCVLVGLGFGSHRPKFALPLLPPLSYLQLGKASRLLVMTSFNGNRRLVLAIICMKLARAQILEEPQPLPVPANKLSNWPFSPF